jgi:hypothetical protein
MADRDKGTDIDKLLAEVDGMLGDGGKRASRPVVPAEATDASPGRFAARVRTAGVSGVVAAAGVFCLFAVLPFFGAFSGAAGAFLAAFAAVLVFRRRR